jgi:hypothetical protein
MKKREKRLYVDDRGRMVDEVVRRSGKKVQKITEIDSDWGQIKKTRVVRGKDGKRIKDKYSFRAAEDAPKSEYNRNKSSSIKTKYKKGGSPFEYKRAKEISVDREGVTSVTKTRNTRSGNRVYKYKDSQGNKISEVTNPEGNIIKVNNRQNVIISGGGKPSTTGVERSKGKETKDGRFKRKTVTKSGDGRQVKKIVSAPGSESWLYKRQKTVVNSGDGRNVTKTVKDLDGNIKKTVTKKPGAVEKEIERGNKRIEVGKYKDEGVKTRTVINMKKNEQYQNDLKGSTFKNFPQQVYDNAMKNKI